MMLVASIYRAYQYHLYSRSKNKLDSVTLVVWPFGILYYILRRSEGAERQQQQAHLARRF